MRTELKRSWYSIDPYEKTVTIKRRERQEPDGAFSEQVQELSASFFVLYARWRCDGGDEIRDLFVTGVHEDGTSVIERWTFAYDAPTHDDAGRYITLEDRDLPRVRREQLYSGKSLGHVRSIEPDRQGRFLLFVTRETPTLYRLDLPGGTPYVALAQTQVPFLAHVGLVVVCQHVTEGIQYHLFAGTQWHFDPSLPQGAIVLRDGNDDAVLDPPEVVTPQAWEQRGYDKAESWVTTPCLWA